MAHHNRSPITFKSPLDECDEHFDRNRRGYSSSRPFPPSSSRPFPPRFPPSMAHRLGSPKPYSRPGPSSGALTSYSRPGSSSGATSFTGRFQPTSYPKELNDMFGALECRLCAVEMTSPIGAKMHYSGKPHMKKIKQFLLGWSTRTGNPLPNFEPNTPQCSVTTLADYCELCDVRLISTNDKMLHYSGKTHRKNERDPANAKRKGKSYDTIDLSTTNARFGIGLGFLSDIKQESAVAVIEDVQVNDFVCELCDVKAVSQDQLNVHINGKKHQERLKKKESGVPKNERPFKCDICNVSLDTLRLLNMHLEGKPHAKVLKKLEAEFTGETCETCNIDFSSYKQYMMHIEGQKHLKKVKQNALRTPGVAKDQKEAITCKKCPYVGSIDDHSCDRSLEKIKNEVDNTFKCTACYDMVFKTKVEYEEHKRSRRHLLCMLNVEGDKISEENIHWYCFTCRKQYYNTKEYCGHLFEHKHMTLSDESGGIVGSMSLWHCNVCAIVMDQVAKDEHMRSKHHHIQAAQQDMTKVLTKMATEELGTHTFYCSNCDENFFSFVAYSEHVLGREHLHKLVSAKLMAGT